MKHHLTKSIKRSILVHWGILMTIMLLLGLATTSCTDQCERNISYVAFEPVYRSLTEIRNEVGVSGPQLLEHPGKIYWRNGYFYINEAGKGIHVINNTDPSNPVVESFINVPGSSELAVQGNIMYVDSYVDLLAIDISDVANPQVVHREEEVFLQGDFGYTLDPSLGLLVDWESNPTLTQTMGDCDQQGNAFFNDDALWVRAEFSNNLNAIANDVASAGGSGVGGSMARFTINQGFLYAVSSWQLFGFDLANPFEPNLTNTTNLDGGIETIYPYQDMLFMGANNGMHIYDVSSPANPQRLSFYSHMRACDPVIVDNDTAYLTLRDGNTCENFFNQLEVIDISNPSNPRVLSIHQMDNPHGLAKEDDFLFLCEGAHGLKSFDVSDHRAISDRQLDHVQDIDAFDVIVINGVVMMIGQDGFYQYSYDANGELTLLSVIPVQQSTT